MSTRDPASGRYTRKALLLWVGITCAGCSDSVVPTRTLPTPPPVVRSIRIEPSNIGVVVGATVQFRAVLDASPGTDTSVRWSVTPSETASITEGGLLSTCYPPALAIVSARSRADTGTVVSAEIPVIGYAVGWAFVSGVVRPGEGPALKNDHLEGNALRDDVDLYVTLNPSDHIPCRLIERLEVWVRGAGIDTTVTAVVFQPPFSSARAVRARFATRSVKNGAYRVGGRLFLTELTLPVAVLDLGVSVANP